MGLQNLYHRFEPDHLLYLREQRDVNLEYCSRVRKDICFLKMNILHFYGLDSANKTIDLYRQMCCIKQYEKLKQLSKMLVFL